ncbi:MAG: hypothetical protein O2894_02160 [Planctomycetota bacterium]|nr:hypothetical protein [Planctomycetota bacterium]
MDWEWLYLLALAATIVIETVLACGLRPRQARRLIVDVPLMNLATHPCLHLLAGLGLPIPLGELGVMAVETLIYRRVTGLSLRWSLALGIGLNLVTWLGGRLLLPG